jgi:tryptophan-rich sensory protein
MTERARPRTPDWAALVVALAASALAQGVGAWLTARSVTTWYPALAKPAWTPPGWLFGPVWTGLYVLMAVAAWLVWRERARRPVGGALALHGIQLVLNVTWSGLFFGLESPEAGLVGIAALWLAIAATLVAFGRARPLAAWLLAPYLAWVSYAAGLNWALWRLNG